MNPIDSNNIQWSENIIIADAEYIDKVAFDLIVNFERMLNRPLPAADLAQWAVCIALDGGLRQTEAAQQTQLILLHDKGNEGLQYFRPSRFDGDLDGQAFTDPQLGEFAISAYPVENLVSKEDFLVDITRTLCGAKGVKRIMVIPNTEDGDTYNHLRTTLAKTDDEGKRITIFSMQPLPGGNFRQEILGYSLMSALGIKGEELKG